MPQLLIPVFPDGVTEINELLAFKKENERVYYFHGHMLPVFSHHIDDIKSFKLIISQFYTNGYAKQSELIKAFGVSKIFVKRAVKVYKEEGAGGFFKSRKKTERKNTLLTDEIIEEVQGNLDNGIEIVDIAKKMNLKADTLRKAIKSGRLIKPTIENIKSTRSIKDSQALMGVGATDILGRVAASLGMLNSSTPKFELVLDVPHGGILFTLPALIQCGLLHNVTKHFKIPKGYYGSESIFIILAFMVLARIKSIDGLRYHSPGEWGKIVGLDRIPEVKTLRKKVADLTQDQGPILWSDDLCKTWLETERNESKIFYIDGHVRVYHGSEKNIPKHYVARERLCLRASVAYWVNTMNGQPVFFISKEVDPGLLKVLEEEIVPRLIKEVPNQPTEEALNSDPKLSRFTLIFDREGYSPEFMKRMSDKRILCQTYNKYPKENWQEESFTREQVTLVFGNTSEMFLAEQKTILANGLEVREIRKLNKSKHQTSILTTDNQTKKEVIAARMFARWSQENFFKYMKQHFNLDHLATYLYEDVSDTIKVVNPLYRQLESDIRKLNAQMNRKKAMFGSIHLLGDIEKEKIEHFEMKKAKLQEELVELMVALEDLKKKKKNVTKKIELSQLPEEKRFKNLNTATNHFLDTIKMIAYRAETSLAYTLKEQMSRQDDAKNLLRSICQMEADIIPNTKEKTLTIRLHHLPTKNFDEAIKYLCSELNATETIFPGTDLRMIYEFV